MDTDQTMKLLASAKESSPAWLRMVEGLVTSLRFGVVQIVVHDSRVVQIDRTEKVRLDKTDQAPGSAP